MPLQDFNSNDDRLQALAGRPLNGFGRLAAEPDYALDYAAGPALETYQTVAYAEPVRYAMPETEPVSLSDQGGGMPTPANAVPVVQTMTASGAAPLTLPHFNFDTGVASCTSCASDEVATTSSATTSNAVTTATNAKVTPLPEAPQTTNWLLWAAMAGLAFYAFKGPATGLGCPDDAPAPAPAPAPALSGLPPRRRPEPHKHLASLKIS
jgi:hypothetical protein